MWAIEPRFFSARLKCPMVPWIPSLTRARVWANRLSGFPAVLNITVQPDGKILVGGYFDSIKEPSRQPRAPESGSAPWTPVSTSARLVNGFFPGPRRRQRRSAAAGWQGVGQRRIWILQWSLGHGSRSLKTRMDLWTRPSKSGQRLFAAPVNGSALALLPNGDPARLAGQQTSPSSRMSPCSTVGSCA
jgi:hypothetical protein